MAGFKVHLLGGMAGGGAVAAAGMLQHHLQIKEAAAVGILGILGGLLPDLDSDTGKPLELLFQLLSVLLPMLLYSHFKDRLGADVTTMLLFFCAGYLAVQYFLCPLIKKMTAHRGIMHSIPFAVLCAQITFLLFPGLPQQTALYYAAAVFLGAMIHLFLDEFYSVSFKGILPRFNRYSGSALAFTSNSSAATLTVYLLLFFTGYLIFDENAGKTLTKLSVYFSTISF